MPEPDLSQQQRAILRAFRQTTAERVQAEVDAEARRKRKLEAVTSALSKARPGQNACRSGRQSKGSWRRSGEHIMGLA